MTSRRYPPRRAAYFDPEVEMPRPVIGLDIDGTLGEYHDHFTRFARGWFGKLPGELGRHPDAPYPGGMPLHQWLGVSKSRYRQCKLAYRRGGLKRSMPVRDGAAELSRTLRRAGAMVVICTTRPFLMLENIDPDTQEWLRRNRIQYDAIMHGEHKYRDLARQFGSRVVMVLEDLPELIKQAEAANCHPVLSLAPHNSGFIHSYVVGDLFEAQQLGLSRIGNYERERS